MKRNVALLFSNQKDIASIAKKEAVVNHVRREMELRGREVVSTVADNRGKTILFNDGSKLFVYSFGVSLAGHRLSNLLIDEDAMAMPNALCVFKQAYLPLVETSAHFENLEDISERLYTYQVVTGSPISFKKINPST